MVGRICALVSVIIPTYLVVLMAGVKGAVEVWPAIVACGVTFAAMQFAVSNFVGPELTDILSSLASIGAMVVVMKVWHPRRIFRLEGDKPVSEAPRRHTGGEILMAWTPYILLVAFVLLWNWPHKLAPGGRNPIKTELDKVTVANPRPALHGTILRVPPVTKAPERYDAVFNFNWLAASGTSCFLAAVAAAFVLGMGPKKLAGQYMATHRQLAAPMLTIASMLGLAFLM